MRFFQKRSIVDLFLSGHGKPTDEIKNDSETPQKNAHQKNDPDQRRINIKIFAQPGTNPGDLLVLRYPI
jgi:hypothetical protein